MRGFAVAAAAGGCAPPTGSRRRASGRGSATLAAPPPRPHWDQEAPAQGRTHACTPRPPCPPPADTTRTQGGSRKPLELGHPHRRAPPGRDTPAAGTGCGCRRRPAAPCPRPCRGGAGGRGEPGVCRSSRSAGGQPSAPPRARAAPRQRGRSGARPSGRPASPRRGGRKPPPAARCWPHTTPSNPWCRPLHTWPPIQTSAMAPGERAPAALLLALLLALARGAAGAPHGAAVPRGAAGGPCTRPPLLTGPPPAPLAAEAPSCAVAAANVTVREVRRGAGGRRGWPPAVPRVCLLAHAGNPTPHAHPTLQLDPYDPVALLSGHFEVPDEDGPFHQEVRSAASRPPRGGAEAGPAAARRPRAAGASPPPWRCPRCCSTL